MKITLFLLFTSLAVFAQDAPKFPLNCGRYQVADWVEPNTKIKNSHIITFHKDTFSKTQVTLNLSQEDGPILLHKKKFMGGELVLNKRDGLYRFSGELKVEKSLSNKIASNLKPTLTLIEEQDCKK